MLEHEQPTCSVPLQYNRLPYFLIQQIAESLSIDDKLNFMFTSQHVFEALKPSFRRFTYLQICDEYKENFLKEQKTGEELSFDGRNLEKLLHLCSNLETIVIACVKPTCLPVADNQTNCSVFDTTLYTYGGYIGRFCQLAPPSLLKSLKNLSLNVDLTVSTFSQLLLPMPNEDLFYSVTHLANCSFNTFIQIGFCSSDYSPQDIHINRQFLSDMHRTCAQMRDYGCKSQMDMGANNDGYVDLTCEFGRLEYSLSYFYYNEKLCQPIEEDETDDADEYDFEFDEMAFESSPSPFVVKPLSSTNETGHVFQFPQ
ncbi:hypothetical protein M3Y94_00179700 [Aphelenchoides besseyi]|nr:hypothetical protein M3Y94_00179700 [Aphelenchoides besseyi]